MSTLEQLGPDFRANVERWCDRVFRGIYHISRELKRAQFDGFNFTFCHYGVVATYDFDELTRMVICAHDLCLRLEVSAAAPKYLRISLSQRTPDGDYYHRHPTIEEAVVNLRNTYPVSVPAPATQP